MRWTLASWAGLWRMTPLIALVLCGCEPSSSPVTPQATPKSSSKAQLPPDAVVLSFVYGSEKKLWVDEATAAFDAMNPQTKSGRPIVVEAKAMGSGELTDEVLSGRLEADLISPASKAFITLANAKSQAQTGKPLVGETKDLVLSPVVIAMWKPMAQALGWPEKPIGWADIARITIDPQGWGSLGAPQWGRFKFGHTHPEYSNSGLISIIAMAYAGAGKSQDLRLDDLANPVVGDGIGKIQQSIVHYGESTGFFGRKMFEGGPEYLSAAVLYENMVIESYDAGKYTPTFPVVAIYPKEGTFWSEHPCGVVDRPWTTAEDREAAKLYMDFLLARPQQELALKLGFRPADVAVPLGAPLDQAHGVDPKEPRTTLQVPGAEVINATIELWKKNKKRSNVVLVMDVSGSMKQDGRIENARAAAAEFVGLLSDDDTFSFMTFNQTPRWVVQRQPLREQRSRVVQTIQGVLADGGTSIYDATAKAFDECLAHPDPQAITAIVVLTDGADRNSSMSLDQAVEHIRSDGELKNIRVFTIGYGGEAEQAVLEKIATATQAKFFKGDPKNIRKIFREISTFF
jgi:Ca-activated chloride channel homolog